MKKALAMVLAIVSLAGFAADKATAKAMTLTDARTKIGEVVADPTKMTAVFSKLSAADQKAFLGEVNAAISKMPASGEERAAKFLSVNVAAVMSAKKSVAKKGKDGKKILEKGNLVELIAEIFATVTPEALTVINEEFAEKLLNRAGDPSVTYTDEEYSAVAKKLLLAIRERTASADNAEVRNGFAMLMLLRASNGTPATLTDTLVETFPEKIRETVAKEWVPSAMGEDRVTAYDPMLGAADATQAPNFELSLRMAVPMTLTTVLAEVVNLVDNPFTGFAIDPSRMNSVALVRQGMQAADDISNQTIPIPKEETEEKEPEPRPYQWQATR